MIKKLLFPCIIAVCCLYITGCGPSESDLCDTAKTSINEKCVEISPEDPATCVSVEITKQISENSWTAKAKLDNGTIIPFAMKLHDNDMLEIDYFGWLGKQIEKEIMPLTICNQIGK